LPNDEVQKSKL